MRPHRQIFNAIETLGGWKPVGFPNIDLIDLKLLVKLSGFKDELVESPERDRIEAEKDRDPSIIDRSPELLSSSPIPVTLTQIIDLKNYYVKSPQGRAKPESVDAQAKFDIYKFQMSQHGKTVTGDPDLKMTDKFFKTFESDRVTLSVADRANLAAATTFAAEQKQIAVEIAQASSLEPKQRSRGFSR